VDAQVKPFVDNAIGVEWLREMRAAAGAADDAYRSAVDALGDHPPARFEVPGELGPRRAAPAEPVAERVAGPAAERVAEPVAERAASVPAPPAASEPPVAGSWPGVVPDSLIPPQPAMQPNGMAPWTSPAGVPATGAPPGAPMPGMGALPGAAMPDMGAVPGGGMPGMGGLSTIPGRIADALTGLLGASTEPSGLDGASDLELPQHDPIDHAEPDDAGDDEGGGGSDDVPADEPGEEAPGDAAPAEGDAPPTDHPGEPEYPAEAVQAPPAAEQPLAQGDPPTGEVPATMSPPAPQQAVPQGTPCEIAADELPHVGE